MKTMADALIKAQVVSPEDVERSSIEERIADEDALKREERAKWDRTIDRFLARSGKTEAEREQWRAELLELLHNHARVCEEDGEC